MTSRDWKLAKTCNSHKITFIDIRNGPTQLGKRSHDIKNTQKLGNSLRMSKSKGKSLIIPNTFNNEEMYDPHYQYTLVQNNKIRSSSQLHIHSIKYKDDI